jgi:hypothetical protein
MAVDETVLRSARNAFLALMVGIIVVGIYQFATAGRVSVAVAAIWVLGAATFYASKYHYGRSNAAATED